MSDTEARFLEVSSPDLNEIQPEHETSSNLKALVRLYVHLCPDQRAPRPRKRLRREDPLTAYENHILELFEEKPGFQMTCLKMLHDILEVESASDMSPRMTFIRASYDSDYNAEEMRYERQVQFLEFKNLCGNCGIKIDKSFNVVLGTPKAEARPEKPAKVFNRQSKADWKAIPLAILSYIPQAFARSFHLRH